MDWLANNWSNIFAVLGAFVTFATAVVAITPTQRDNAILAYVVKFMDFFSVINPKAPKA